MLEEFRLFSFEYRVFYRLSFFIYKINSNGSPLNLYNHLKFNYSVNKGGHNLRNKDQLYISKNLKSRWKTFFSFFSKIINITTIFVINDSFLRFKSYLKTDIVCLYNNFNNNFQFFNSFRWLKLKIVILVDL